MPAEMHSVGRTQSPKKARILPVASVVKEGRTRNTPANTIVSTTSAMRTPVNPDTIPPCHSLSEISCETRRAFRQIFLRPTFFSSVAFGGSGNTEHQRKQIDQNSQPNEEYAYEDKKHKRKWMKPQEAHNFDEQTQNNQAT